MKFFQFLLLFIFLASPVFAKNYCAITFDDGPSKYTEQLLSVLEERGIPATFFVLGENAQRFPNIVRRELADGDEVGNHSWSHPDLQKLSLAEQAEEIGRTSKLIRSLGGKPKLFRPPYGNSDEGVKQILEKEGLVEVLWSVDSLDWKRRPKDYSRMPDVEGRHFKPDGMHGIFLFHDIQKRTVDDIEAIIDGLTEGGCDEFVTVSEYLKHIAEKRIAAKTRKRK